jgi:DHA2 family multidrug resistance protein
MITASIMLATIMQGVDNTIANVALPHIQGSLSAAQDQIAWVLTSYIVAVAIMTPLTGWLAGRLGIKYVFLFSVAGFTLASALCGSATSLSQLVFYRLLQGACGAGLVPLSQSVLMQINPPERHGQAIAIWGIGVMLGPIFGPMLGGWLTQDYSWRWIFYINLPVGVITSLGILVFIRETRHTHREAFDFFGFVTLSIAVGALQMLLDRGELKDWFNSTEIWAEAAISGVAFYLFIVHTATASDRSFINLDLLKSPNFMAGTVLMFFVGGILSGTLALLPTMLQSLMNYPVFTTGLVTAPRGIGTMVAMFLVGRMIQPGRQPADHPRRVSADGRLAVADDRIFAADGNGARHLVGLAAGLRARLHLRAAQHAGVVEPAASHPDARDGDAQLDAQPRRQHRHLDL